jgi:hypothetical protein
VQVNDALDPAKGPPIAGHWGTEANMDAIEPPRVVFESPIECVDRDRADELLRQALAQARARGWVVTVRIQPATLPEVSAEGEVADETGALRARQVASGTVADCAGLATAMGVWASSVLASALPIAPASEPVVTGPPDAEPRTSQTLDATASPIATVAPPAPAPAMAPVPKAPQVDFVESLPGKSDDGAPLELGVGTFMMAGGGAGGYLGVAPFLIDDIGNAVFLRPSVALGESTATNVASTWAAARIDTCMRLPGRYAVRGGLQLDVCGGADVGFSYVLSGTLPGTPATGQTFPYVDLGPSVDLRAEVGKFAVTLRGVAGIDVAREGFVDVTGTRVDEATWSWRLELDFSWVFHNARTDAFIAEQTAQ